MTSRHYVAKEVDLVLIGVGGVWLNGGIGSRGTFHLYGRTKEGVEGSKKKEETRIL